jgi:hypothetical protein
MKHSPADIVRYYVAGTGICSMPTDAVAWPGYTNYLADAIDNAILFTDTNGTKDGRINRTGETVEHPGLQVLVRGTDQQTAWQRIDIISKLFDATSHQIVAISPETYEIIAIHRKYSVIPLSTEEHYKALERQGKEIKLRRFIFVLNAIMTLETDINYQLLPGSRVAPAVNTFWHNQIPAGALDGMNTVFTIAAFTATFPNLTYITIDGVLATGYIILGPTITFTAAPTGSVMVLTYV